MSKIAIIQSNFLPWKGYFDFISRVDDFVFFDTCQYTKRDWRNRNKIKVFNGDGWISVPVSVKSKFEQKINETIISDDNWAQKIWNKIEYNYKKAPYFNFVKKELFDGLMFKIDSQNISVVNQKIIQFISRDILGINTRFHRSEDFDLDDDKNLRLIKIVKQLHGDEYISGSSAKIYLKEDLFSENGIKLSFMNYDGYLEYPQLHGDFDHFVSIIDLLFMEGPNAKNFLLNRD